jgi:hypothetical protein
MNHGAYLLINVDTGQERDIQASIASRPYVKQCSVVSGLHDLICYIESDTVEGLKDAVYAFPSTRTSSRDTESPCSLVCLQGFSLPGDYQGL